MGLAKGIIEFLLLKATSFPIRFFERSSRRNAGRLLHLEIERTAP
jgi:hypothetical protein